MRTKQIEVKELPFPEWLGTERITRYKLPSNSELLAFDPDSPTTPKENIAGGKTILLITCEYVKFVLFAGEIVGKISKY